MSEMSNISGEQPIYKSHIPPEIKGSILPPVKPPIKDDAEILKQTNLNDDPAFLGGKSQVKPAKDAAKFEKKPFVDPANIASDIELYSENAELLAAFKNSLYEEAIKRGMEKEEAVNFAEYTAAAFMQLPE